MGYQWVSTEARTGEIITDLPLLNVSTVKASVGRYETAQGTLPINTKDAPPEWERAVKENAAHLILLADNPDDPAHGIPVVGYRVQSTTRDQGDTISLDLATVESYLDSRYVGNATYTNVAQNLIVQSLVNAYAKDGAKNGIPIRVQILGGNGAVRTRQYSDSDDKTLYSVLTDLMGVEGGPEWFIGWEWQHNPERITPVLYVGDRVGSDVTPGFGPAATFEMPGPVTAFKMVRDYKQGRGANDVMATSSGTEDVRPQSPHVTDVGVDQPTVEYRFTPSTSITDVNTLTGHAQTALSGMKNGSISIELSAVAQYAPQLGVDWNLGDTIGYVVGGTNSNGDETVPAFPGGIAGSARAAGWSLELTDTPIVTPILVGGDLT